MQSINSKRISLGKPITAPFLIPVTHNISPKCINQPFMVNGEIYKITCISFGNPHGIVLVDDVDKVDVSSLGALLGKHVLFPKGANIVFLQVAEGDELKAKLWQQGEEIEYTLESAGAAVTVAIMLQKIIKYEGNIAMGSKKFNVKWDRVTDDVSITELKIGL